MAKVTTARYQERTYVLRKIYGETQNKFADRLGVSRSTVYRYEKGLIKNPQNSPVYNKINSRFNYWKGRDIVVQPKYYFKKDKAHSWGYVTDLEDIMERIEDRLSEYRGEVEFMDIRVIKMEHF